MECMNHLSFTYHYYLSTNHYLSFVYLPVIYYLSIYHLAKEMHYKELAYVIFETGKDKSTVWTVSREKGDTINSKGSLLEKFLLPLQGLSLPSSSRQVSLLLDRLIQTVQLMQPALFHQLKCWSCLKTPLKQHSESHLTIKYKINCASIHVARSL